MNQQNDNFMRCKEYEGLSFLLIFYSINQYIEPYNSIILTYSNYPSFLGGPGSVLSNSTSSNINTPSTAATSTAASKVTSSSNQESGRSGTSNRGSSRGKGRDSLANKFRSKLLHKRPGRHSTITAAALKCMDIRNFVLKSREGSENEAVSLTYPLYLK